MCCSEFISGVIDDDGPPPPLPVMLLLLWPLRRLHREPIDVGSVRMIHGPNYFLLLEKSHGIKSEVTF